MSLLRPSNSNSSSNHGATIASASAQLIKEFSDSIRDLETLALLKINPNRQLELKSFSQSLCKTELLLEELEARVKQDLQSLENAKHVVNRLKLANSRTKHLERNLTNKPATTALNEEQDDDSTFVAISRVAALDIPIDQITLPSLHEFEYRLKPYMRPIPYEIFHRVCLLVNKTAQEKKRLLTSTGKLTVEDKQRVKEWKLQQDSSPDLTRVMFITEQDVISGFEDKLTSPADVRAGLECLRGLGIVRKSTVQHNTDVYVFLK
jgi:hypothetical protein